MEDLRKCEGGEHQLRRRVGLIVMVLAVAAATVIALWRAGRPEQKPKLVVADESHKVLPAPDEVFRRCSPAVATVLTFDKNGQQTALGSGFFLTADGRLATNHHVIAAGSRFEIVLNSQAKLSVAGVLYDDAALDLALLKVNGNSVSSLSLANAPPEVGVRVYAIGSPLGLSATISEGLVSGVRAANGVKLLQTTAAISAGSSGGPLLNSDGAVVGVTTAYLEKGQNLNFAVSATHLADAIAYLDKSGEAGMRRTEAVMNTERAASITDWLALAEELLKDAQLGNEDAGWCYAWMAEAAAAAGVGERSVQDYIDRALALEGIKEGWVAKHVVKAYVRLGKNGTAMDWLNRMPRDLGAPGSRIDAAYLLWLDADSDDDPLLRHWAEDTAQAIATQHGVPMDSKFVDAIRRASLRGLSPSQVWSMADRAGTQKERDIYLLAGLQSDPPIDDALDRVVQISPGPDRCRAFSIIALDVLLHGSPSQFDRLPALIPSGEAADVMRGIPAIAWDARQADSGRSVYRDSIRAVLNRIESLSGGAAQWQEPLRGIVCISLLHNDEPDAFERIIKNAGYVRSQEYVRELVRKQRDISLVAAKALRFAKALPKMKDDVIAAALVLDDAKQVEDYRLALGLGRSDVVRVLFTHPDSDMGGQYVDTYLSTRATSGQAMFDFEMANGALFADEVRKGRIVSANARLQRMEGTMMGRRQCVHDLFESAARRANDGLWRPWLAQYGTPVERTYAYIGIAQGLATRATRLAASRPSAR